MRVFRQLGVCFIFVVVAACLITPVSITTDGLAYAGMVRGESASAPYCFRIFVPWLVHLTGARHPAEGLKLLTWACMGGVYFLGWVLCRSCGVSQRSTGAAIVLYFCSRPNLFNFSNPYLTDAAGLLCIFALCVCFVRGRIAAFIGIAAIGALVRESALFPCAAWVFSSRWRKWMPLLVIPTVMFAVPRLFISADYGRYLESGLATKSAFSGSALVQELILSWGYLWLVLWAGWKSLSEEVRFLAYALVLGSVAGSLVIQANDYERMLGVLAPVIIVATGNVIDQLPIKSLWIAGVAATQFLFGNPYFGLYGGLMGYKGYRAGLAAATIGAIVVTVFSLLRASPPMLLRNKRQHDLFPRQPLRREM